MYIYPLKIKNIVLYCIVLYHVQNHHHHHDDDHYYFHYHYHDHFSMRVL